MTIAVVVEPDGDRYHAFTPALRGIHADGATEDDALREIVPLIFSHVASMTKHGEAIQLGPSPEMVEHPDRLSVPPTARTRNVTLPWASLHTSGAR